MHRTHIVGPLMFGCAAIAMGLIPGLLADFIDGFRNFSGSLRDPRQSYREDRRDRSSERIWFIAVGAAAILIGVLAALAD